MKKGIWIAILLVLVVGSLWWLIDQANANYRTRLQQKNLIAALQDTVRYYKTSDSTHVATISVIQTESANAFIKLKTSDKQVQELQKTAAQYRDKLKKEGSITKALVETAIDTSRKTNPGDVVFSGNTKDSGYQNVTFNQNIHNKWIDYDASMSSVENHVRIKVKNEFSVVIGTEKGKPFADLITENPYSAVKSLRTFDVSLPPAPIKRWGIGPAIGGGFDNNLKPTLFVGVTLQYNVIRFR